MPRGTFAISALLVVAPDRQVDGRTSRLRERHDTPVADVPELLDGGQPLGCVRVTEQGDRAGAIGVAIHALSRRLSIDVEVTTVRVAGGQVVLDVAQARRQASRQG